MIKFTLKETQILHAHQPGDLATTSDSRASDPTASCLKKRSGSFAFNTVESSLVTNLRIRLVPSVLPQLRPAEEATGTATAQDLHPPMFYGYMPHGRLNFFK